jgi:hypothetical protein
MKLDLQKVFGAWIMGSAVAAFVQVQQRARQCVTAPDE